MAYDITFQARALPLVREAIVTTLTDVVGGRIYWQQAPQDATYPYIVFQSQDNGGKRADHIDENGWSGLITFRAIDTDPDNADAVLATLPALLESVSVDGYTFRAAPEQPIPFPPQDYGGTQIYTAAMICAAELA